MKLALYRVLTDLGGPLIRLYLERRLKRGKEDRARFRERLGFSAHPRPAAKRVAWVHAASVGESLSVLPVVDRVLTERPDWFVLVTTGTVTSARLMAERLPGQDTGRSAHQYVPVDRTVYVRRFLDHWRPDLALWVESEFWPNLVIETHARGVPMVVLNGRMSERSYRGWLKHRAVIARLLGAFQLVLARGDTDAARFCDLGAESVEVPGNLKFAQPPLPANEQALARLVASMGARPRWLAASTHAGEEEICARVHLSLRKDVPGLLTVIVPRHPERGPAIACALHDQGLNVALRSADAPLTPDTDIYVADTLGELGLFYRLCDIVFMGKTLAGGGGQNPIEAAILSSALLFGPDMSNFEDIADALSACGGALWVKDAESLAEAVAGLLADGEARERAVRAAHDLAKSETGVLNRMMGALGPYFEFTEAKNNHART
ncbi:MAG: 3-deoxy-D-manno-octulosonic acid transferase [Alphaproteobacteria bacterium]|nr:3-deoxy-D-manno-octulosonic acid transferase [Alphaproteobacteria bacterium]